MPKLTTQTDFTKVSDPASFMRFCSQFINDLINIINGKVEFDVNIQSVSIDVTFTQANTDTAVTHTLNKTGVRYFPVYKTQSCDVFNGTGTPTKDTIYLQCNKAMTVTMELF